MGPWPKPLHSYGRIHCTSTLFNKAIMLGCGEGEPKGLCDEQLDREMDAGTG